MIVPGIYNSPSVRPAERAGSERFDVPAASVAHTQLGRPDVGLLSLDRIADYAARIRQRALVATPMTEVSPTAYSGRVLDLKSLNARPGLEYLPKIADRYAPFRPGGAMVEQAAPELGP